MEKQLNIQTAVTTKVSTKTQVLLGIMIIACIGAMFAIIGGFKTTQDNYVWTYVGQPRFTTEGTISFPSLAIDNNNVPYFAFVDATMQPSGVSVMTFNGSSWEDVGGTHGLSTSTVAGASLAIDNNNVPYVAYGDNAIIPCKATVKKFNGSTWEVVGTPGFTNGIPMYLSFAIDNNNVPYVAYNGNPFNKLTVMKFNGSTWEVVGTPEFTNQDTGHISLAIDNNNVPYVAYVDSAYNFKLTVMKFNGSTWEVVGTPGFSITRGFFTSLAIDNNNVPYVAYTGNVDYMSKAMLMKFNGSTWKVVGSGWFSCWSVVALSLVINENNIPYVGYSDACPEPNYTNYGRASVMKYSSIFSSSINNLRLK